MINCNHERLLLQIKYKLSPPHTTIENNNFTAHNFNFSREIPLYDPIDIFNRDSNKMLSKLQESYNYFHT